MPPPQPPTRTVDFECATRYEELTAFPANHRFPLRLWLPEGGLADQIVVMTHGFLDGARPDTNDPHAQTKRYASIATELNHRGIAAVLLPLPFHFERGRDFADRHMIAPIARLRENGAYMYFGGYDQMKDDVVRLVQEIRADPARYGLSAAPQVHLLGYSLGGAAVLGAAASLPAEISSLSALFSTWGIARIPSGEIQKMFNDRFGFGSAEWATAMSQLESQRSRFDPVFQHLMWGESDVSWFEQCPRRLLFIHGLDDELFPDDMTSRANEELVAHVRRVNEDLPRAKQHECAFIRVFGNHLHLRQMQQVAGYVAAFIGNPGGRVPRP